MILQAIQNVLFYCMKEVVWKNYNKPHQTEWMRFHFLTTFKARRVFFVVCISSPITFLFILKKKKLCVFIWICVHSRFLLLLFFTTPFSGMLKSCPFNNFFTSCLHILLWFPIFQKGWYISLNKLSQIFLFIYLYW